MVNMGGLPEISEEQEEKELREAFKVFDRTGNGYITSSDLRSVLQCLGEQLNEEESKHSYKLLNWVFYL
jgi:Ca2+-binding EF-hand superfamily protein